MIEEVWIRLEVLLCVKVEDNKEILFMWNIVVENVIIVAINVCNDIFVCDMNKINIKGY